MNALFFACVIAIAGFATAFAPNTGFELDFHPVSSKNGNVGEDVLCELCINVDDDLINVLLNYILNNDIIGGCDNLCSHAPTNLQGLCELGAFAA